MFYRQLTEFVGSILPVPHHLVAMSLPRAVYAGLAIGLLGILVIALTGGDWKALAPMACAYRSRRCIESAQRLGPADGWH